MNLGLQVSGASDATGLSSEDIIELDSDGTMLLVDPARLATEIERSRVAPAITTTVQYPTYSSMDRLLEGAEVWIFINSPVADAIPFDDDTFLAMMPHYFIGGQKYYLVSHVTALTLALAGIGRAAPEI